MSYACLAGCLAESGAAFTPLSLNPILYLDARNPYGTGVQPADGTRISTGSNGWKDLSTNSYIAGQSTGAAQPLFQKNIQNGNPAISYSGSQSLSIPSFAINAKMTLLVGCRQADASLNTVFIEHSADTNSHDGFYIFGGGSAAADVTRSGSSAQVLASTTWLGTNAVAAGFTYDDSTIIAYKDFSSVVSQASSLSNTLVTDTLFVGSRGGAALFFSGYLYYVVVLNYAASATQLNQMHTWSQNIWATP